MNLYIVSYFSFFRAIVGSIFMVLGILFFLFLGSTESSLFSKNNEASLIIIDRSLSMSVEDIRSSISPDIRSRLDLAKEIIRTGSREKKMVGVITFAKNPTLFFPISEWNPQFYELINGIAPESDIGGSDLPLALQFAKNLYGERTLSIIVFTDGGSTSTTLLPRIPENWRITVYGLGTEVGGKIPLGYNANGERRYKYFSGSEIIVPYEKEKMESFTHEIGANLIHRDGVGTVEENSFLQFLRDNMSYTLATVFLLLGTLIHPYGRKKINI